MVGPLHCEVCLQAMELVELTGPRFRAGSAEDLGARQAEAERLAWQYGLGYLSREGCAKLAWLIAGIRSEVSRG